MQRFISVLLCAVCLLAIEAFAQDWGTDAGSWIIINGSDGVIDSAGEGELNVGGVPIPDSIPDTTTVLAVFNLGPLAVQGNKAVNAGDTIWLYYELHNQGNTTDSIDLLADTVVGSASNFGEILLYHDVNGDSLIDAGDTSFGVANNLGALLAEDGNLGVLAGIVVPGAANDGDFADVAVTIKANGGIGTDDNWPAGFPAMGFADNGDAFFDTLTLTVGMPVIYFLSQVDKATAAPGETLTYTMTYDNDGSDSTASAGGGLLVRQLLPKFVTYIPTSLDFATAIHAGGAVAQFSSIVAPGTFNQTGAWADASPDSVAGFEVSYDTDIAPDDTTGDAGTDLLGSADGTIPDPDAGQITFKVIVK